MYFLYINDQKLVYINSFVHERMRLIHCTDLYKQHTYNTRYYLYRVLNNTFIISLI